VVHHQSQRYGQPGKGIEVQVDFEEVKQDGRDAHIDDDAKEQHAEVPDVAVDQEDEGDQDQDGKAGTLVDLVQLFFQELHVVVFQPYLKAGGKGAFGQLYRLFDFFGQQHLVCPFACG